MAEMKVELRSKERKRERESDSRVTSSSERKVRRGGS